MRSAWWQFDVDEWRVLIDETAAAAIGVGLAAAAGGIGGICAAVAAIALIDGTYQWLAEGHCMNAR